MSSPLAHPCDRLTRPIPGEGIGTESAGTARRWERDRPAERPSPIPARDQAPLRSVSVKMTTRVGSPSPNAPLLIRLVRHPYALDLGRGKRVAYRGDDAGTALSAGDRPDWHGEVRAALAERVRVRSTSGVESRPLPFAIRPSLWQLLPETSESGPSSTSGDPK